MKYLTYVLRRLVHLLPVAFGITLVVFFMIHLVPGDPARTLLGTSATAEGVAALRASLGLDQPLWTQYLQFLGRLVQGDLGDSLFYKTDVNTLILERLPATLWLLVAATVLSVLLSVPLAVLAASRRGTVVDQAIRGVPLVGLGMPAFWVGIILILLLSLKAGLFPVAGFGDTTLEHLHSIVLPGRLPPKGVTPPGSPCGDTDSSVML